MNTCISWPEILQRMLNHGLNRGQDSVFALVVVSCGETFDVHSCALADVLSHEQNADISRLVKAYLEDLDKPYDLKREHLATLLSELKEESEARQ